MTNNSELPVEAVLSFIITAYMTKEYMTKKRLSGENGPWGLEKHGTLRTRLHLRLFLEPRMQEESSLGSSRAVPRSLTSSLEAT